MTPAGGNNDQLMIQKASDFFLGGGDFNDASVHTDEGFGKVGHSS